MEIQQRNTTMNLVERHQNKVLQCVPCKATSINVPSFTLAIKPLGKSPSRYTFDMLR
jgi:hypothetical protein